MKKCFLICLSIVLLLQLCACNKKEPEIMEPVNFYYCNKEISYNTDTGVIQAEVREGSYFHGDATKMLKAFLAGPNNTALESPLPSGTQIVSYEQTEDVAQITFSEAFESLSGLKLSTACSCIVLTLHDYINVDEVHFYVENGQIENKNVHIVKLSDIILIDYMQRG